MRYLNIWLGPWTSSRGVSLVAVCAIISLVQYALAQSPQIVQVGEHVSICIDPPSPTLIVRADLEKAHNSICKTWSRYRSTVANLAVDRFSKQCNPAVPVVNQFAAEILSAWVGRQIDPPSTAILFGEPAKYGVRPLLNGEPRTNKLIVWSGGGDGMVGVVVKDDNSDAFGEPDIAKLQILYPSKMKCGELNIVDAKTLAKSLSPLSRFKLMDIVLPHYYWNHWLDGVAEQTDPLPDNKTYSYRIDFSPIDFRQVLANPTARPIQLKSDEAQFALPELRDLRLIVLPYGKIELVDGANSFEKAVELDQQMLHATLISGVRTTYANLNEVARQDGALRWNDNGNPRPVFVHFRVKGTGCAGFSTIVWSNQGGNPRLIAAWSRDFFVYETGTSGSIGKDEDECGQSVEIARRMDPGVVVPQFPISGQQPAARLSFVDLGGASIGAFEDLDTHGTPTTTWVLEAKALRKKLSGIVSGYDRKVTSPDFDAKEISGPLEKLLFSCKNDEACPGRKALARLREIAAERPQTRVEARFRDSSNTSYYVPIQLVLAKSDDSGKTLGEVLQFVYPMPFSSRVGQTKQGCVRSWTAGLVVKDDQNHLTLDWQQQWPINLGKAKSYDVRSYLDMERLRAYFKSSTNPSSAEGLILLAHHNGGFIAANSSDLETSQVDEDHLNKVFQPGSFGMFAACSVGAVGESQRSNSLFLHGLNQRNMDAAIVSPYRVHNEVAKALLDKFREIVVKLASEKTLYEVFADTRDELLKDSQQLIHSNAKLLMLLGDVNIKICKP